MKAVFQFKGYKIDRFNFEMLPVVELLDTFKMKEDEQYDIKVGFKQPVYSRSNKVYVSGVNLLMALKGPNVSGKEAENIFKLEAGIAGSFYVEEKFDGDLEQRLVKFQIPSILMPYLRAAITSFLGNAGFSAVVLPLFNIYEMAKDKLKDVEIIEID